MQNEEPRSLIKSLSSTSKIFRKQIVILAVVIIILISVFAFLSPYFFTIDNAINIILQATVVGLLALGNTFILISGGIDLSSVANLVLSGVIGASVMASYGLVPGILTMLIIGTIFGVVNALAVVKLKMLPFIVTLAMMSIGQGLAFYYTKGRQSSIVGLPESFANFTKTSLWIIPLPVIVVLIVFIIAYLYLARGSFGRSLSALGLSKKVAIISGIRVARVEMSVYVLSGFLAGLAAVLVVSKLDSAGAGMVKNTMVLDNMSAAIIGGASLYGGRGSVGGTILGVLFIVIIGNALHLLGVPSFAVLIVKGFIILFAIFMDTMRIKYFGD